MKGPSQLDNRGRFNRGRLDETAASLLTFLAAEPERFDRFLSLTGLSVGGLRAAAGRSDFAGHLLAYLASDEPLLLAYARDQGRDPAEVAALAMAAGSSPTSE